MHAILRELESSLAESDAAARKVWATDIIEKGIPLKDLFSLFQADDKTVERFTWLIGDLSDMDASVVAPCMPFLFSLRDQMPFRGINRSVAKWLWRTGVPQELEIDAIDQLFDWLDCPTACIASKHYSAKALTELAVQGRTSLDRLKCSVKNQIGTQTDAHSDRMRKLFHRLGQIKP